MSQPQPDRSRRDAPRPTADPTMKVARPPVPGRAVRADVAAGDRATPPFRHDEPTETINPHGRPDHRRTLEFGTPGPVKVTVGPRRKPKRRHRTTPWIAAVVLALIVLGAVLLVMMWRGATIDGDTDLIGAGTHRSLLLGAA